jgi:PP-loop superfamily ATP-utilizing enzyme
VPDAEIPRLVELRASVVPALKRLGYANVTIDLAGFTSGGFNALLAQR